MNAIIGFIVGVATTLVTCVIIGREMNRRDPEGAAKSLETFNDYVNDLKHHK